MAQRDYKSQSVRAHDFAMVPRADIPRSSFNRQTAHKTTFDAGPLVPVFVDEVLPGDTMSLRMTAFCRMSTPIFPIMDNMVLESFFFFVPNRLVWSNWEKFMGSQLNPGDSIDYVIPQVGSPVSGWSVGSLGDYFGLPIVGQLGTGTGVNVNTLPFRGYNLIYNEWFRDENLINSAFVPTDDGPDAATEYPLLYRGKRHDYFTSCLPFLQKGPSVTLPLGTSAPVKPGATEFSTTGWTYPLAFRETSGGATPTADKYYAVAPGGEVTTAGSGVSIDGGALYPTNLYADLSAATADTINQLRQSFQIQKLLERDARGGTRYTEVIRAHFGVISPDARLQRPEYLGGGSSPVNVGSVPQTSATGLTGGTTPAGSLSAFGTIVHHDNGFSQSFTEHGYVIGLINVRADLTYQNGIRKLWSRSTRYDFYFPVFAMLGEQAVLNQELSCVGNPATDGLVFGYQERWAEYRYFPAMITGLFRSQAAGTLDAWHLAQNFPTAPALGPSFISESPPVARVIAAGSDATSQQFLADIFFDIKSARAMPMYSVPGLIDHF